MKKYSIQEGGNMKFDKKAYDRAYMKERRKNIKPFKVDLKAEEKEELDMLLKQNKIRHVDFLRNAINNLKEELKMEKNKNFTVKNNTKIRTRGMNCLYYEIAFYNEKGAIKDTVLYRRNTAKDFYETEVFKKIEQYEKNKTLISEEEKEQLIVELQNEARKLDSAFNKNL